MRERGALRIEQQAGARSALRVTVDAILINILNPKLSIFFFAFLPQFVRSDDPAPLSHMLLLSACVHAADLRRLRRLWAVRGFGP